MSSRWKFGPKLTVTGQRLENGLDIYLLADPSAPVVSYQTWFRVGSRHEKPGKTGLAHLFEHLMFNETKNLAAGAFDRQLEAVGGETNAATWTDWTYYYDNVPKAEIELAVRLEADRMANLVLRKPQVTSEKEVVANERRYRVDDDVEGTAGEELYAAAFSKHPYHWPTIGWMKDIKAFTTEDCRAFYRTYYAPNNALLVIAGDIDERKTLGLVKKYYGRIGMADLPKAETPHEPPQKKEKRLVLRKPTSGEKLDIGYRAPAFGDYDWAVLTVANEILFGGRSSRLYRALVSEGELASEARGSLAPFRDPGLYEIWIGMRPEYRAGMALDIVDRELDRLMRRPVSERELEKAKNRLELGFWQALETASGKASQVGFYAAVLDDPGRIFARLEDYRRVTASEIRRCAEVYLPHRSRTIVKVVPSKEKS